MKAISTMIATACVPFDVEGPGFALPLFTEVSSPNKLYVQELDEYTNLIADFKPITEIYSAVPLTSKVEAKTGNAPIYTFIDEKGLAVAGKLSDINQTLRSFLVRRPEYTAICVQVMELVGGKEERRDAKIRMRQTISQVSGNDAASIFYERSSLQAALWEHLISRARSEEATKRIFSVRSKLEARFSNDGVKVVIDALDQRDRIGIDEAELMSELLSEFDPNLAATEKNVDLAAPAKTTEKLRRPEVERALFEIKQSNRQEKRLAIIFDVLLHDVDTGVDLLEEYQHDPALFTTTTIARLRQNLFETKKMPWRRDAIFAEINSALIDFYGMRKGELLLEFAERLGKYPEVYSMIKSKLRTSRSHYVEIRSRAITRLLNRSAQGRQQSAEGLPLFHRK